MIAICIGHSRKINGRTEGGAHSPHLAMNEHAFNSNVASRLSEILTNKGVKNFVVTQYEGNSYGSAMAYVAGECRSKGATLAIELHFNSASTNATGHEWLHWHTSSKGRELATKFDKAFSANFPHHSRRGVKPIDASDRGGSFLSLTPCPAVILEPFFGSSLDDSAAFAGHDGAEILALTYATAITGDTPSSPVQPVKPSLTIEERVARIEKTLNIK